MAHGSAGGGGPADGAAIVAGGATLLETTGGCVGLACGVLATVESPDPQPAETAATDAATATPVNVRTRHDSHHTSRTVPSTGP